MTTDRLFWVMLVLIPFILYAQVLARRRRRTQTGKALGHRDTTDVFARFQRTRSMCAWFGLLPVVVGMPLAVLSNILGVNYGLWFFVGAGLLAFGLGFGSLVYRCPICNAVPLSPEQCRACGTRLREPDPDRDQTHEPDAPQLLVPLQAEIRSGTRLVWIGIVAGTCLMIVGVFLIAASGNVIAVRDEPSGGTIVLVWGLIFAVFGLLTWWRAPRYYRRLARIYLTGNPQAMQLTIETRMGSQSNINYVATVHAPSVGSIVVRVDSDCLNNPVFERIARAKNLKLTVAQSIDWPEPVQVYGARETGPVVIEVGGALLLWPQSDVPFVTRRVSAR